MHWHQAALCWKSWTLAGGRSHFSSEHCHSACKPRVFAPVEPSLVLPAPIWGLIRGVFKNWWRNVDIWRNFSWQPTGGNMAEQDEKNGMVSPLGLIDWFHCVFRTVCDADLNAIATHSHFMEQLDILGTREVSRQAAQRYVTACHSLPSCSVSTEPGQQVSQYEMSQWPLMYVLMQVAGAVHTAQVLWRVLLCRDRSCHCSCLAITIPSCYLQTEFPGNR